MTTNAIPCLLAAAMWDAQLLLLSPSPCVAAAAVLALKVLLEPVPVAASTLVLPALPWGMAEGLLCCPEPFIIGIEASDMRALLSPPFCSATTYAQQRLMDRRAWLLNSVHVRWPCCTCRRRCQWLLTRSPQLLAHNRSSSSPA